MDVKIFRINYKSDFILTLNSDAGWMTPFCIKFWTGAPSQAYFVGWDGETYTHCAPVDGEPTKLRVQFDDHHLPIGDLKFQIGYHFTVADFPTSVEDEVLNQASVIIEVDDVPAQVMLDLNGETAPEIEFSLPAYANEAQRIANEEQRIAHEQQRIANEDARIQAEETRQYNEQQRIQHEEYRVSEFARLKSESEAATDAANTAATLANEKAQLAADKAALADAAATLANEKAQLAADKSELAQAAATLANEKAALAQQKAEYAQTQGDYAKAQGDYAKAQGDTAQADHVRAEADHTTAADDHSRAEGDHTTAASDHSRAESDHTTAASDHSRAESDHTTAASDHTRAESDHTTAASDHTRAESDHTTAASDHETAASDHTRAESDHAAVEVYVDSLGAFDISSYHATGGELAKYANLTAALGTDGANIPEGIRKGGMSVKFVQSSDNKYVQYRLMATDWSNSTSNWQGVDSEIVVGSKNLVESGAAYNEITPLALKLERATIEEIAVDLPSTAPNQYAATKTTIVSKTGWGFAEFTITGYEKVRLLGLVMAGSNTDNIGWCWLKSNNAVIEGLAFDADANATEDVLKEYIVTPPVNAVKIRVNWAGSKLTGNFYMYLFNINPAASMADVIEASHTSSGGYNFTKNGVNQATVVAQDPSVDRTNIPLVGTTSNYALVGDGKAREENGFEIRKYAVTAGDTLYLKLSKDTGVDCVCQFQNTASLSTSSANNCIASPVLSAIDGCVVVPRYATHLIVCCAAGNATNKVQQCTNIRDIESGDNIYIKESLLSHNLAFEQGGKNVFIKQSFEQGTISECMIDGGAATTKTDIKETSLSSTLSNAFIVNFTSDEDKARKYAWRRGVLETNTSYYSQLVNVLHDKYYYINTYSITDKASLALYDVDGNVLDITNNTVNGYYKFPENVHHIIVSALVGNWSYVEIAQVNIADYLFPVEKINGLGATLNDLQENKVDSKSINLVNPDKIEDDKAIYIYNSGYDIRTMTGYSLSGYIPVNRKNIATNALNNNSYWGHAVYNADKVKIRTFNTSNYTYQEGDVFVRFTFGATVTTAGEQMANYGNSVLPYEAFNPIAAYISGTDDSSLSGKLEVAIGKTFSSGSYESEIEAQPIVNNQTNYYVGYKEVTKPKNDKRYRRIVAVNHDDLPQADYTATRKIYNKYGFNASFCFILQPFFNASHKSSMVEAVKRLLHEGHEMGLHAIMNSSYWRANKMVDIRPDGGSNFAPQYSELIGHNQDKTGSNDYEQSVTSTTKLSALGYANPVNSQNIASDLVVVSMTEEELNDVNASYNFYSSKRTLSGLDEEDTAQTKTHLAWLEYWYNLWIDNTLGTSSTAASLADRFAEDYSVPEGATVGDYYPDAEHMWNGKMVYWNDTTNAHYADAKVKTAAGFSTDDYQLVGKFTKGLYKDCFSTANYEVMDRVIHIAQEFARRYFGLDHFTDTHVHGVNYINIQTSIFLRNKGFIVGGHGRFYRSRLGCFSEEIDLLNEFGINLIDYDTNQVSYEGQVGLYQGMDGRMDTRVSSGRSNSLVFVSYLNFFGNNVSENMSYSAFVAFTNKLDNWLKFAYENAGQQVTRNGYTYTVFDALKNSIDIIRATFDTGKIPVLSLDTLGANPSIVASIGLLCNWCKQHDIDIVSLSEARRLAMVDNIKANYFPNPAFNQSLLLDFGGSSTSSDAYVPDGWQIITSGAAASVSDVTIASKTYKALTISGAGTLETRIYGIPAGNYKLSFYASGSGSSAIKCWIKKNGNSRGITGVTPSYAPTLNETMTLCEFEFTIEPDTKKAVGSSNASKICGGYEDNFSNLQIQIQGASGGTIKIANPILTTTN